MKRSIVSKLGMTPLALLFMLLTFSSCKKDEAEESPKTITNIVTENSNYSILESAVVKADLGSTLNGAGPFTVFAPDDAAFNSSGITGSVIQSLTADQLKDILLYHTLGSKVMAANVPAGPNAAVTTSGGETVYVTKNNNGVFVNGWKVKTADIAADNGVIHSIEHVLMPPMGNIVEVAQSNDEFSYLVAAVLRASQGNTNVAAVLTSDGPFTVFAPTNQAFIDAGFPTIASIESADPNTLASILTYHVLDSRAFSSDLMNGQSLSTVNGEAFGVEIGSNATVKGNSNTSAANILAVNIMATNGVVHVIDQVLLP